MPKHGYRFIAPVERVDGAVESGKQAEPEALPSAWRQLVLLGTAGTLGGGAAGILVGLFYGFGWASQPLQAGLGAVSVLLVLVCLSLLLGLLAGAGVSFGIAAAVFAPGRHWHWSLLGGAAGGMLVGAFGKLVGLDAFNLLFGQSPGNITGAGEGALIGAAVGLGAWLASSGAGSVSPARSISVAALAGGAAGILIAMLGGRLMGGSLDLLAQRFPASRLRLDEIGALFGESGFGPVSQTVTGAIEAALFSGCIVGAMVIARRLKRQASGDAPRRLR